MFICRLDDDIFEFVKNGTKNVSAADLDLDENKEEFVKLLGRFYSDEEQEEYGVVAIEFKKVI